MTLVRLNVQHSTSTPLAAVGSTFHVRLVNSLLTDFLSVDNNGTLGDNSDDTLTSLSIAPRFPSRTSEPSRSQQQPPFRNQALSRFWRLLALGS